MEIIYKYFPDLSDIQIKQFEQLQQSYTNWNSQINVISRKDIDHLYERHVLHSLAIAKVVKFNKGSKILDIGTGGGFPGIPLAILFPECDFKLVDSIGKKIKVVENVSKEAGITNVDYEHIRAEKIKDKFDFIVSRAVTNLSDFVKWTNKKFLAESNHDLRNGILYLKGGDLKEELAPFKNITTFEISQFFNEPFFETKFVVHLPRK